MVKGFSAKEIANALQISTRTVEHHFEHIKKILNCTRRSELIKKALKIKAIRLKFLSEL